MKLIETLKPRGTWLALALPVKYFLFVTISKTALKLDDFRAIIQAHAVLPSKPCQKCTLNTIHYGGNIHHFLLHLLFLEGFPNILV